MNLIEKEGCAIQEFQQLCDTKETVVLCHQVNCQGKMGSGIAGAIKAQYPRHYADYIQFCDLLEDDHGLLGKSFQTKINMTSWIGGIFGQRYYGYDDKLYTDYVALEQGFRDLIGEEAEETIVIPKYIGCGLANGDWSVVESMIKKFAEEFPNKTFIIVEKV